MWGVLCLRQTDPPTDGYLQIHTFSSHAYAPREDLNRPKAQHWKRLGPCPSFGDGSSVPQISRYLARGLPGLDTRAECVYEHRVLGRISTMKDAKTRVIPTDELCTSNS